MGMIAEITVSFFLVVSGIFGLIGSFGMIRLKDTMQRLHAPTKATTLGVGGALIASMLFFALFEGRLSFHEIMVSVFLFLTSPIIGNFIAKAHMHQHVKEDELPPTGRETGWAGYDDPPLPGESDGGSLS